MSDSDIELTESEAEKFSSAGPPPIPGEELHLPQVVLMPGESGQLFYKVPAPMKLFGFRPSGHESLSLVKLIAGGTSLIGEEGIGAFQVPITVAAGTFIIAIVKNEDESSTAAVGGTLWYKPTNEKPKAGMARTTEPQVGVPAPPPPSEGVTMTLPKGSNHVLVCFQRSEAERLLQVAKGGYPLQAYETPGIQRALQDALEGKS